MPGGETWAVGEYDLSRFLLPPIYLMKELSRLVEGTEAEFKGLEAEKR